MKKVQFLIIIGVLLCLGFCEDLHFGRAQVCIKQGLNSCLQWNTTIDLTYYYYSAGYMCFPGSTRVQTSTGPKEITEISVGDEILAYDFNQGKNVYSKVIAFLHRDTNSTVEFTDIKIKGSNMYRASSGHNIAFNQNGTIDFKEADQLLPGDELISVGGQSYIVESADGLAYDQGLYSPFTAAGNFYIYPYQSVEGNDLSQSLILVHCLAQIDKPKKQEHWIYTVIHMADMFGLNAHQNQEHEAYLHPVTHLMKLFIKNHKKVKYSLAHGDQKHLQSLPYNSGGSSSSWSWGSGSSSYSSYGRNSYWGSPYYYNSYSSQQQQKQNRKRQLIAIFASLMQVNSVITSV